VRRRTFIAGMASAAAWPVVARAQQSTVPVVGYLGSRSIADMTAFLTAYRAGLSEVGYVEGRNLTIEYRWAEGQYDRMPELVADLVQRNVAAISADAPNGALAAKTATSRIPIIFATGADPVGIGLVASLNRPGGNMTGVNLFLQELARKRLQLLHEFIPRATAVGVFVNPRFYASAALLADLRAAADSMALKLLVAEVSTVGDFEPGLIGLMQQNIEGLVVVGDPVLNAHNTELAAVAAKHSIPAISGLREFALEGGLVSYGASLSDALRLVGVYTGRILNGEKPAELPVVQSTKVELVVNMKTAKALDLTIPLSLLGRADEVIE
jgi:putative ABC transport system substrate-binding protein